MVIVTLGIGAAATFHICEQKRGKVYVELDENQKACFMANFKATDPSRGSLVTISGAMANSGTINQNVAATQPDIFRAAKGISDLILYVDPVDFKVIDSIDYSA